MGPKLNGVLIRRDQDRHRGRPVRTQGGGKPPEKPTLLTP